MTDDQIRELISGRKLAAGETFEDLGAGLTKIKIGMQPCRKLTEPRRTSGGPKPNANC